MDEHRKATSGRFNFYSNWGEIIPAPQMHEIAQKLHQDRLLVFQLNSTHTVDSKNNVVTNDYHFAEACAQLYMKHLNENIIKQ